MIINCPSCQSKVSVTDDTADSAVCESCGGTISTGFSMDEVSVVNRLASSEMADDELVSTAMHRSSSPSLEASPWPIVAAPSAGVTSAAGLTPTSPAEAQLVARKSIGPYEILEWIGKGGFGLVFLARHKLHGRREAIKVPLEEKFRSKTELGEFLHEARVAVQLEHAHIVPVYHADHAEDGTPYIAMKYIDGVSMAVAMQDATWTTVRLVRLLIDVADALHYAHALGFVHRDLKPGNILIDRSGNGWVSDFGLALHSSEQLAIRGDAAGTLRYSSPEQVRGLSEHMDGRTDIYSFGVILYEVLTGRPLFEGTRSQISEQILRRPPVPPSQRDLRNEVPPELESLCLTCLEKEITRRPASMSFVAKSLRNWLHVAAPELCPEPSATHRPDAASGDRGRGASSEIVSARTIAIATQPDASPQADHTTAPAASADTDRTIPAKPVAPATNAAPAAPVAVVTPAVPATRVKVVTPTKLVVALMVVLGAIALGVVLKLQAQSNGPPLMDAVAAPRVPVRLLDHAVFSPEAIVMPPREENFDRIYDAAYQTLKLESPAICCVALGRVENLKDWQLDVSFSKSSPFGQSGACWGLQPVPEGSPELNHANGEPAWRLQILWLDYQGPDRTFLRRRIEYFRKIDGKFQGAGSVGLGGEPVSLSAKPRQEISLGFRGPYLAQVIWNGNQVALDDGALFLTTERAQALSLPNPLPHSGPFGVISDFGATMFERVEFMNLGAPTP